jgi:hypothetical protein
MTSVKIPFLLSNSVMDFDTNKIILDETKKLFVVGTTTGEILVYQYSFKKPPLTRQESTIVDSDEMGLSQIHDEKKYIEFVPLLLLLPDYAQKSGPLLDFTFVESPAEEIIVIIYLYLSKWI